MAYRKERDLTVRDPEQHRWGAKYCYWCRCAVAYLPTPKPWTTIPNNWATREHLQPKAHNGSNARENIVVACFKCNHERGSNLRWRPKQKSIREMGVINDLH